MTDPRRPGTKEAQLPDALDQIPSDAPAGAAEEHGSEDAQLLAEAKAGGDDVEAEAPDGASN
jgi:hypothetical protein